VSNLGYVSDSLAAYEQGFMQVGNQYSVCPQPLLIENIKLNLRTKVESCLSSPNHSLDLQLADVCWSSPTCIKPNVSGSLFSI
jgi:hypothetical protein